MTAKTKGKFFDLDLQHLENEKLVFFAGRTERTENKTPPNRKKWLKL